MAKKIILVIEDEEDLIQAIKIRLEFADYQVLVAYDGSQGLDMVKQHKPDLILLDIMLPKIDGYKVCSTLKNDQEYKKIPIIILTARAQEEDERLSYEAGANAFITKPFEYEVVVAKIKELLVNN